MLITLMRKIAFGALLCHMALTELAIAETQIPDDYHGVWQPTTEGQPPTCVKRDSDIRQTVRARRIDFHEGICTVQSMAKGENALQLRAHCEQEDSKWVAHQEWKIKDVDGLRYLTIRSLDPSNPYEALYGLCPSLAAEDISANAGNPGPGQAVCYRDGMSELEIRPNADGTANIDIESVQGNAHICSLMGTARRTNAGYQYSASLDDGRQCELTIVLDATGGVTFKDPDWKCKQYHCGARASFERIAFQPSERIPCK